MLPWDDSFAHLVPAQNPGVLQDEHCNAFNPVDASYGPFFTLPF